MGRRLHVVLRVAQVRNHRQADAVEEALEFAGGPRAGIDAHGDDGDKGLVLADFLLLEQLVEEMPRRQDVENRRLQGHDHAPHQLQHMAQLLAMQAGRRVEHDMGGVLRRPRRLVGFDVPGGDPRQRRRAQLEPFARGLLAVDVTEHDTLALAREPAGEIGRQRGLADATLGIGDQEGFHFYQIPYGSNTVEPVVLRATRSIWACAASFSA